MDTPQKSGSMDEVDHRRAALGVPEDGYPNTEEGTILFFTNRMRTDPRTFDTTFGYRPESTKVPVPPVSYALDLNKAARWQARHLAEDGCPLCDDHSSCCPLGIVDGEVQCTAPVTTCGVTAWRTRIGLFSSRGGISENAASGTRSAEQAMWAWLNSGGHWDNLTRAAHLVLGPGAATQRHVQVFGGGSETRPIAAYGSRFQRRLQLTAYSWRLQDADKPSFGQVYYKPGGGPPKIAMVVVEGVCHDLSLAYGAADHGSYEKELTLPKGCHRYIFHFRDSAGVDHVYPSKGSLVAAVDDTPCLAYDALRPTDSCSPSGTTQPPADQGTPPPADQGTPPPADQGTPPPADQGTPPPADQGTPPPPDRGTAPMDEAGQVQPSDGKSTLDLDGTSIAGEDSPSPREAGPGEDVKLSGGCSHSGPAGGSWILACLALLCVWFRLYRMLQWRDTLSA